MPDDARAGEGALPSPTEHRIRLRGVEHAVHEWPGADPPIVTMHGTGHHAHVWLEVLRRLQASGATMPRVLGIDYRGHGRSEVPSTPVTWPLLAEDAVALLRHLDVRDATGLGHSMGGTIMLYAAGRLPGAFDRLLLLDPTIFRREQYLPNEPSGVPEDHMFARRRNHFDSPEAMFERFRQREPFDRWTEQGLRDYCQHALVPAPGGDGYVLACPGLVEAQIYSLEKIADLHEQFVRVQAPVRILRARGADLPLPSEGFMTSQCIPDVAEYLPGAASVEVIDCPELAHHIPLEDPELVARHLREVRG